eukprot:CAMPEP_0176391562 /NCGR_PEP_ID=MMETSP0126-20121128/40139_1 /TAXON_ID=141414 ORGANISM="Strombidinopsis acuminatum, Strain SPMC142" /NCGR_SAMPLE_ID=MMETSP0126 /ASSEMBLY_ACC=CAM_ASM_000229 /LENGTH=173 /DNA_ID=CAMNT_0017761777 /DNA_START=548 /DNA_END=1069 /DNA_ORIENTATION=-
MPITDELLFDTFCLTELINYNNIWYDPIDPLVSISQNEICDLNWKLFEELRKRGRTSLAEYTNFSILAGLDLYLNAYEQDDYENCIDLVVEADSTAWSESFVDDHEVFLVWDQSEKAEATINTADAVDEECAEDPSTPCQACSAGLARIYKEYEIYINELYEAMFTTYTEEMY